MSSPVINYLSPSIYIKEIETQGPVNSEETMSALSMHEVEKPVGATVNQTPAEYLACIEQEFKNFSFHNPQVSFKHFESKLPSILAAYEKQPDLGEAILTNIFFARLLSMGGDLILGNIANKESEEAASAQIWMGALEAFLLKVPVLEGKTGQLALDSVSLLNAANYCLPLQQKLVDKLQQNFSHVDRYKGLKLLLMVRNPIKKAEVEEFLVLLGEKINSLNFESLELCRVRTLELIKDYPQARALSIYMNMINNTSLNKEDVACLNTCLNSIKNTREPSEFILDYIYLNLRELPAPKDPVVLSSIRDIVYRIYQQYEHDKEARAAIAEKILYVLQKLTPNNTNIDGLFPGIPTWRDAPKSGKTVNRKRYKENLQKNFCDYISNNINTKILSFLSQQLAKKLVVANQTAMTEEQEGKFYTAFLNDHELNMNAPDREKESQILDLLRFYLKLPEVPSLLGLDALIKIRILFESAEFSDNTKFEAAKILHKLARKGQINSGYRGFFTGVLESPNHKLEARTRFMLAGVASELNPQRKEIFSYEEVIDPIEVSQMDPEMVDALVSMIDKSDNYHYLLKLTPFNDKIFKASVRMVLDNKAYVQTSNNIEDVEKKNENVVWTLLSQNMEELPIEMHSLLTDVLAEIEVDNVDISTILNLASINFLSWNGLNVKPSTMKILASLPQLSENNKVYATTLGLPALLVLHLKKHPAQKEEIESILANICTQDTLRFLNNLTSKKSAQELFDEKIKAQKIELEGEINVSNESLKSLKNSNITPTDPIEILAFDLRNKAETTYQEACVGIAEKALKALEELPKLANKWKKKRKRSFQKAEFDRIITEKQNLKNEASKELKGKLSAIEGKIAYLKAVDQRLHTLEANTREQAFGLIRTIEKKSGGLVKKIEKQTAIDIQSLFAEALTKNSSTYVTDITTDATILNIEKSLADKIEKFKEGLTIQQTTISGTDRDKIIKLKSKLHEDKVAKKADERTIQTLLEEMERIKKQNAILQKRLEAEKLKNKNVIIESFEEKTLPELWEAVIEQAEFLQTSADPIISKKYAKVSAKLEKRDDTTDKAYFKDLAKLCGIKKHRQNGTSHGQYDYKLSDGRTTLDGTSTTIAVHAIQPKMCDKAIKELLISLLKVMNHENGVST